MPIFIIILIAESYFQFSAEFVSNKNVMFALVKVNTHNSFNNAREIVSIQVNSNPSNSQHKPIFLDTAVVNIYAYT